MTVKNININCFIHESMKQGKEHKYNTADIYGVAFKPTSGEGKYRMFSFIVNNTGKRVGIRFYRTGKREITYVYLKEEGLFMGAKGRKLVGGNTLSSQMKAWLYHVLDDGNTFKYNYEQWGDC